MFWMVRWGMKLSGWLDGRRGEGCWMVKLGGGWSEVDGEVESEVG